MVSGDDWLMVSIDGYIWGTRELVTVAEFQVFTPAYNALSISSKPLFIPEFSCSEHGGDKAQWIRDMFTDIPSKFPRIFALMWFNQTKSAEADWAVNTSEASLNAWKDCISKIATVGIIRNEHPCIYKNQPENRSVLSFGVLNPGKTIYNIQGCRVNNMKFLIHSSGIYIEPMILQKRIER